MLGPGQACKSSTACCSCMCLSLPMLTEAWLTADGGAALTVDLHDSDMDFACWSQDSAELVLSPVLVCWCVELLRNSG